VLKISQHQFALARCRFLPGSREKKFARDIAGIDSSKLSPLQIWNLHRLCIRYRKQIGQPHLIMQSNIYMMHNPTPPMSRREAQKQINKALKAPIEPFQLKLF